MPDLPEMNERRKVLGIRSEWKEARRMEKEPEDHEKTNLKIWIWIAVIDIMAIVITGLLIFSWH